MSATGSKPLARSVAMDRACHSASDAAALAQVYRLLDRIAARGKLSTSSGPSLADSQSTDPVAA